MPAMVKTDYHAHCAYCDGSASPREMAEAAERAGLSWFGLSSHAPLHFSTTWNMDADDAASYRADVRALAGEFRGRLGILLGMEIDWMAEAGGPARPGSWGEGLDYRIGSVHFVRAEDGALFTIDSPEEEFQGDLHSHCPSGGRPLIEDYYARVSAMAKEGGFDILGHFDLPKKNNQGNLLFDEDAPWYRDAVMSAVEAVSASGAVVEVNTGGISRKRIDDAYPSTWILSEFRSRGVRVAFSSDAHRPDDILAHRDMAFDSMRKAGYREIHYLTDKGWQGDSLT
jgi:histidinol-phosphatase (PHP family)